MGGQQERAEKYTCQSQVKETGPCVFACIEFWDRTKYLHCCLHLFNNAHLVEDGPPVLSEVLGTAAGELIDSDKRKVTPSRKETYGLAATLQGMIRVVYT